MHDVTGVWEPLIHEDAVERLVGRKQGDFSGIPLNEAGRAEAASWNPDAKHSCLPEGAVYMLRAPARFQIETGPDNTLTVTSESYRQPRTLKVDGKHPASGRHSPMGDSVAWWSSDSLVVETTNMSASLLQRNGAPYSEDAKMTEFFSRLSGSHGDLMHVVQVIEDPKYLRQPLIRSVAYRLVPNGKLGTNPCVVGE
ncbi:MAG: hypothetical protein H6978_10145 [Gammaproteobacteria bacterium]|nr:hypothetical protein [Gammaproteobacteria bacterium]